MRLKAYLEDLARRGLWDGTRPTEDLLAHCFGLTWSQIQIPGTREINPQKIPEFEESLVRLRSGYPLAYIIGEQEFLGQKFVVN